MKKRIIILGLVILVVIAAWTGGWLYLSMLVRQNLTALADADGVNTPKVTCATLDIGGYPFWMDVTCSGMGVVQGDATISVGAVKATVLAYDPFHVLLIGTSPLTVEDAFTGSKVRLDWKNLEASGRISTGFRLERVSIVGETLALSDAVGTDIELGKADHAEFHLLDVPSLYDATKHLAALRLYSVIEGLAVPGAEITAGQSTLDATISNLPDDVRTYNDPALLRRWQAAGGKLKLNGFKGSEGAEIFAVTGNLALDQQGRPTGQLNINSKGLVERFGAMIPAQAQSLVLGNKAADGSYSQTLNLSNGLIFSGILPLGSVPSVY
jgi:hypothetical protein